jgi:hypothetical protein
LAVPGSAYTTEELVELVYDWREYVPEKKHTVSVLRAAKRLCERDRRYTRLHRGGPGSQFVFFDGTSFESYLAAIPKAHGPVGAVDPFTGARRDVVGGLWWKQVEQFRAQQAGDWEAARRLAAEIQADHDRTQLMIRAAASGVKIETADGS